MRLAAISDLHGNLDFDIKESDILCICGDIVPLEVQSAKKESKKWLKEKFIPWCNKQKVEEIYLIGGNHDFFLFNYSTRIKELFKGTNIHYLEDSQIVYTDDNGVDYLIYGSPWCKQFGYWAFMGYSNEGLEKIFRKMPENIDILLTHDAPYGCSDVCEQDVHWNKHEHIGSIGLRHAVIDKKPKLLLHGHLHTANHNAEMLNETTVYNVSVLDERYNLYYEPLYLDYDKN